jgi:thymidylate kinase
VTTNRLRTIKTAVVERISRRPKKPAAPPVAVQAAPAPGVAEAQVRDEPILLPADDLLGMDFYAQHLVEYVMRIRPPFTVGIYGEWGAGKTSLVQLLHYHVEARQPGATHFIKFSAWRYKAADELWRALILAIAQKLHGRTDDGAQAEPTAVPRADRVRRYLQGAAWRGDDGEQVDPYDQLVERLDATLYGGISRGRTAQTHLNDDEMMVAALKTATTALESVSPFFAMVRKLFGLDDKVDFASLLHRQKNEATRARINSIEQFRDEIKKMFEQHAANKRVCVFIDDLDRVMPDAALDLMEAIRSLLDCVNCTFIVAADQQLIGQGLKARFRDIDAPPGMRVSEFYEKKGREYFEKIVQLGIPVPEPTMDEAHRYIAALFPAWAAASDLLVTACGTNPRRLKQYCVLADYRLAVWKKQQEHQGRPQ